MIRMCMPCSAVHGEPLSRLYLPDLSFRGSYVFSRAVALFPGYPTSLLLKVTPRGPLLRSKIDPGVLSSGRFKIAFLTKL